MSSIEGAVGDHLNGQRRMRERVLRSNVAIATVFRSASFVPGPYNRHNLRLLPSQAKSSQHPAEREAAQEKVDDLNTGTGGEFRKAGLRDTRSIIPIVACECTLAIAVTGNLRFHRKFMRDRNIRHARRVFLEASLRRKPGEDSTNHHQLFAAPSAPPAYAGGSLKKLHFSLLITAPALI